MTDTTASPEIQRLARLLHVRPGELMFLADVEDQELRLFRDQVSDALFDAHTGMVKRLGAASKLLPTPVTARIAQKVFGPLLIARIAGQVEPVRAALIAKRLPVGFLTDVAVELDPRRSQRIITELPTDLITEIAIELARREDWLTLGRFVGYISEASLRACLARVNDVQVLRTAFAVDDPSCIPMVLDLLQPQRLPALLRAASAHDMWPTMLSIAGNLRDDQIIDLAAVLANADAALIEDLVEVAAAQDLWAQLLPVAASLPEQAQEIIAETAVRLTPESRAAIVAYADGLGITDDLGPIADALAEQAA